MAKLLGGTSSEAPHTARGHGCCLQLSRRQKHRPGIPKHDHLARIVPA